MGAKRKRFLVLVLTVLLVGGFSFGAKCWKDFPRYHPTVKLIPVVLTDTEPYYKFLDYYKFKTKENPQLSRYVEFPVDQVAFIVAEVDPKLIEKAKQLNKTVYVRFVVLNTKKEPVKIIVHRLPSSPGPSSMENPAGGEIIIYPAGSQFVTERAVVVPLNTPDRIFLLKLPSLKKECCYLEESFVTDGLACHTRTLSEIREQLAKIRLKENQVFIGLISNQEGIAHLAGMAYIDGQAFTPSTPIDVSVYDPDFVKLRWVKPFSCGQKECCATTPMEGFHVEDAELPDWDMTKDKFLIGSQDIGYVVYVENPGMRQKCAEEGCKEGKRKFYLKLQLDSTTVREAEIVITDIARGVELFTSSGRRLSVGDHYTLTAGASDYIAVRGYAYPTDIKNYIFRFKVPKGGFKNLRKCTVLEKVGKEVRRVCTITWALRRAFCRFGCPECVSSIEDTVEGEPTTVLEETSMPTIPPFTGLKVVSHAVRNIKTWRMVVERPEGWLAVSVINLKKGVYERIMVTNPRRSAIKRATTGKILIAFSDEEIAPTTHKLPADREVALYCLAWKSGTQVKTRSGYSWVFTLGRKAANLNVPVNLIESHLKRVCAVAKSFLKKY